MQASTYVVEQVPVTELAKTLQVSVQDSANLV